MARRNRLQAAPLVGVFTTRDPVVDMRWLLGFVQTKVDGLAPEALYRLKRDVFGFVDVTAWLGHTLTGDELRAAQEDPAVGGIADQSVTRRVLLQLQADVRACLAALEGERAWQLPAVPEVVYVGRDDRGQVVTRAQGSVRAALLAYAVALLVRFYGDVRTCARPGCGVRFLRDHKRTHCSTKCAQAARWARFAPKRKARQRDTQREYARKIRRAVYPRARFTPRPRKTR